MELTLVRIIKYKYHVNEIMHMQKICITRKVYRRKSVDDYASVVTAPPPIFSVKSNIPLTYIVPPPPPSKNN